MLLPEKESAPKMLPKPSTPRPGAEVPNMSCTIIPAVIRQLASVHTFKVYDDCLHAEPRSLPRQRLLMMLVTGYIQLLSSIRAHVSHYGFQAS